MRRRHHGFSTAETLVALASSAVLMMGLASAIFVAGQSIELVSQPAFEVSLVGNPLAELRDNIQEAIAIDAINDALVLTVPDRYGDQLPETIEYVITDNQLLESINGGATRVIASDINIMELKTILFGEPPPGNAGSASASASQSPMATQVGLHGTSGSSVSDDNEIEVPLPAGVQTGDLIVLMLAVQGTDVEQPTAPAGWNLIESTNEEHAYFSCWYRLHTAGDSSVTLTWTEERAAIAWTLACTDMLPNIPDKGSSAGFFFSGGGAPGPAAESISASSSGSLVIQTVVTQANVLSNFYSGLTGFADVVLLQHEDLQVSCSVKHLGESTGTNHSDTFYIFNGSDIPYITFGALLSLP
ncbi:PulJ/GspJ family protein [Planctomycetaceae bacterium SH139]